MFLQTHNRDVHGVMSEPLECRGGDVGAKAQKLQRPTIPDDCSEVTTREENYFHLFSCCSDILQYKLYMATGGTAKTMAEVNLMKEIKQLAVLKVNAAMHVKEFWEMKQDPEEPVRQYQERLQGKALS